VITRKHALNPKGFCNQCDSINSTVDQPCPISVRAKTHRISARPKVIPEWRKASLSAERLEALEKELAPWLVKKFVGKGSLSTIAAALEAEANPETCSSLNHNLEGDCHSSIFGCRLNHTRVSLIEDGKRCRRGRHVLKVPGPCPKCRARNVARANANRKPRSVITLERQRAQNLEEL